MALVLPGMFCTAGEELLMRGFFPSIKEKQRHKRLVESPSEDILCMVRLTLHDVEIGTW